MSVLSRSFPTRQKIILFQMAPQTIQEHRVSKSHSIAEDEDDWGSFGEAPTAAAAFDCAPAEASASNGSFAVHLLPTSYCGLLFLIYKVQVQFTIELRVV